MGSLQVACLHVRSWHDTWQKCVFNLQQQNYAGGCTEPHPSKLPSTMPVGRVNILVDIA
jgi:hypothetical protein